MHAAGVALLGRPCVVVYACLMQPEEVPFPQHTWKLLIQGCCSMCRTVGRAGGALLRAAVMNCLAGSDMRLGKDGAAVHIADCMDASDAPAALKGALQDTKACQLHEQPHCTAQEGMSWNLSSQCSFIRSACLHAPHTTEQKQDGPVLACMSKQCLTSQSAAHRPAHPLPMRPQLLHSVSPPCPCCRLGGA